MPQPKIAIVCDWLTNYGGAERVIEQFHKIFPTAPIFTPLFNEGKMPEFGVADIRTSYLQNVPGAKNNHQIFLFLYPGVFESFDLDEYDIVLSSSHSCAKGVITKPETLHVCYCHSPMRYAWDDSHKYLKEYSFNGFLKKIVPSFMHKLRMWDRLAAERVDFYIANSDFVRQRIEKYYNKIADVIHPPVDMSRWIMASGNDGYFLAVGRLTAYKKFDFLVETFNSLGWPLKIIGVGPEMAKLKQIAARNIEFLGRVADDELLKVYMGAKGLIFPQVEDFGIVPLEAMACGKPVVAYKAGGSLETVVEGETGVFFDRYDRENLSRAVRELEDISWSPVTIRKHAEAFDISVFQEKILNFVDEKWKLWQETMR